MKSLKTKLHHHRVSKRKLHGSAPIPTDATELWALDHDHPDADFLRFSMERSPKQENL